MARWRWILGWAMIEISALPDERKVGRGGRVRDAGSAPMNRPVSAARYGPYLGEQVRGVVEQFELLEQDLVQVRSMLHVLRRATFAGEQVVRDVLRFGMVFPSVLVHCSGLLGMLVDLTMLDAPLKNKGGG